ncbi:MAG: hypothetical protein JST88_09380 [Bacteroidetes bacterium]|nr:hypothetical protein [Bacteroidota bacterium]
MARTIAQIQADMIAAKNANPNLAALNSTSAVAIWRLWVYVFAVCVWTMETVLDISISQQTAFIKATKIHSFTWYQTYAKAFQFGSALPWGEVSYDNSALTPAQVSAQQVVQFASVTKTPGGLMVKVAGINAGVPSPITSQQFAAFQQYMFRISAAGDNLYYKNQNADSLVANLDIYYDALVLDSTGKRLDGTNNTPVATAVDAFIKQMDFNGRFVPQDFVDWLQKVEGVKIIDIKTMQTKFGNTAYTSVPADGVIPDAGYLRLLSPADLILNYKLWKP